MEEIEIKDIDKPEEFEIEELTPEEIEVKEVYVKETKTVTIEKTIKEKGLKGEDGVDGTNGTNGINGKDGKCPTKKELKALIKEVFPEDKLLEKLIKKMPKEEVESIEIGEDRGGKYIKKGGKKMYLTSGIGPVMATGVHDFLHLTDAPHTYVGQGGKIVKVKADETGLEFAPGDGTGTVTQVDTDSTLTGGPITTTGTLGLNLSNANTWSAQQSNTSIFLNNSDIDWSAGAGNDIVIAAGGSATGNWLGFLWDSTNSVVKLQDLSGNLYDFQVDTLTANDAIVATTISATTGVYSTLRATGSGGLLLESNSGTDVALFGAGNGSGATFYGGVNVAGVLSVDTNVLYVDTTNDRVGLSLSTPQSRLHLSAAASTAVELRITNDTIGNTSSDGFTFGITGTGIAEIRQRENLALNFYTNNTLSGSFAAAQGFSINSGMLSFTGTLPNWTTAGATKGIELPNNSSIKWAANGSGFRWGASQFTGGVYWQQNSADSGATALYRQIWTDTGSFQYFGTGAVYNSGTDVNHFPSLLTVSGRGTSTSSPFLFMTHLDDTDSAKNLGIGFRCRANAKYMAFGMTGGQWDNSFGSGAQGWQVYYAYQFTSRTFSTAEAPTVLKGWHWQYYNGSGNSIIQSINILSGNPAVTITKTEEQLRLSYDASNYFSTTVSSTGGVTFNAVGSGAGFTFSDSITLADAKDFVFNTTTGTKHGTATTQKQSFWNATPIVQPTTAVAAATFVTNTSLIANDTATFDGYTIGQVVKALRNIGLLA